MSTVKNLETASDGGQRALAGRMHFALDKRRFGRSRGEYYEYLAALLAGLQGSRTLRSIFERDAQRYGANNARGRLSRQWARVFVLSGGDLYTTWLECVPLGELSIIRSAQLAGNAALTGVLRDLAGLQGLMRQARRIAGTALWSALAAMLVFLTMMLAIPVFTVPQLLTVFAMLPSEYYGGLTQGLFGLSAAIRDYGVLVAVGGVGLAAWMAWSLPNLTGSLRRRLDHYFVWKIYRQVGGLQLVAALTVILNRDEIAFTQLRTALAMQRIGGSNWQQWQIETMLRRIDAGLVGADTFDTGFLDRETFWFLDDMTQAHGLVRALGLIKRRMEQKVLIDVARQVQALRWGLLLFCVSGLLSLGIWHYAVIDELRRSLMLFYASQ